jgi:hypothetical protein
MDELLIDLIDDFELGNVVLANLVDGSKWDTFITLVEKGEDAKEAFIKVFEEI